jgi:4-amino-4-deoxy-L-arabinose transferase-like glycosyltransferase
MGSSVQKKPAGQARASVGAVPTRPAWVPLLIVTLIALAIRLVAVCFLYTGSWNDFRNHLLFGFETGRIARSIALGHGYSSPMLVDTGPTAWMTPLYPYLLAGVFKLFGIYSETSAFVILSLNSLFSALICIPLFLFAGRGFGRTVALLACWLWALWPYSIYLSASFVWETCLSAFLLAILFLWTLKIEQQSSLWAWLGYGLLWGFAALSTASMVSIFPFLAAWVLCPLWNTSKSRSLRPAALVLLGLFLALLPWQVRNYRVFHRAVPLRDSFWISFWIGNDGNNNTWADINAHPTTNPAEQAEFVRLGEISYMQWKRRQSLDFLAAHPGLYTVNCARRFLFFWSGYWNSDPHNLALELHGPSNLFLTCAFTLLMLLGLWQAFRASRRQVLPYLLILIFYPLVFYLTDPEPRYRHLIEPELIVLVALGVRFLAAELFNGFPQLARLAGPRV